MPLVELVKIPAMKEKVTKALGLDEIRRKSNTVRETQPVNEGENDPIIIHSLHGKKQNPHHEPSFILLRIQDMVLHNYMLDFGASINVMPLSVMYRLGL